MISLWLKSRSSFGKTHGVSLQTIRRMQSVYKTFKVNLMLKNRRRWILPQEVWKKYLVVWPNWKSLEVVNDRGWSQVTRFLKRFINTFKSIRKEDLLFCFSKMDNEFLCWSYYWFYLIGPLCLVSKVFSI